MQHSPKYRPGPPAAWGAVPVVPVALAFGLGVWVADRLGYLPPGYWLAGAVVVLLAATGLVFRASPERWRGTLTSGLILLLAFCLAGWRTNQAHPPGQADFFADQLQPGDLLAGTIGPLRPGERTLRTEIALTHLLRDSTAVIPVSGQLLAYLPPDEQTAELRTGDGIVLRADVIPLRRPLNPHTPDLRPYWNGRGIFHETFLRADDEWRRVPGAGGGLRARAEAFRRGWYRTFQRHLSGDNLAVAAALVMGQRDGLSQEVRSAYTDTGAVHVLAVSGLHVGIIYAIITLLLVNGLRLDRTRAGRWFVFLLTVAGVWLFALVSGGSISVIRSAVMFSVVATGRLYYRKMDVFNSLALAALALLWWQPVQLFQVGFQLSFAAIVGIVLFTRYLERMWEAPTVILRRIWSAMAASTGAQLGTLPLSLFHFGKFPVWFLLSGTAVVVTAFGIMGFGLLHGLVAGVAPDTRLATMTGGGLNLLVEIQNAFVFFFWDLPGGLLRVPVFPWNLALLLVGGVGLLAAWLRWRNRWAGIGGFLLCGLVLFWARTLVRGEVEKAGPVVYHVAKGTLIDVPSGNSAVPAYAFGTPTLARNLAWTAGGNRERYGYTPEITLPLTAADTVLSPGLAWNDPILDLPGYRFLVLDGERKNFAKTDLSGVTHALIINGYKPVNLPELPAAVLLVIDGSNPYYRRAQWRELAAERELEVWVTGEDGALVLGSDPERAVTVPTADPR